MFAKSLIALIISAALVGTHASDCHGDQKTLDECYMQIALDFAKVHNPKFPFGALIVDHGLNTISCYGANSNKKNKLLHGETAAFWNCAIYDSNLGLPLFESSCTEMYPSPTQDDMFNPGLDWSKQTLYTTGEPCPMCASQSIYRGVSRVVWGTSIPDINRSGRQQLMIRMQDVVDSARLGGLQSDRNVPELVGGVLKEECDAAFLDSFSVFRDNKYVESMKAHGEHEYLRQHGIVSPKDEL